MCALCLPVSGERWQMRNAQHLSSCMTPPATSKSARTSGAREPVDKPVAADYESALTELEQLVNQLDAGQLPLEQMLSRYQRGAELLAYCRQRLEAVEQQIQVLDDGQLRPWSAN